MKKIIGINGIYSDGSSSTDIILNELKIKKYKVFDFNYNTLTIFNFIKQEAK